MYSVYDYGVVTHTHTHTRARAQTQLVTTYPVKLVTTCPSVIFFIFNRIMAAMFEILILLTSPRVR